MSPSDPNFDWVTARSKCTPAGVLSILQLQSKSDVEKRNSILTAQELQYGINFQITTGREVFRVARTGIVDNQIDFAMFAQTADGISVSYKDDRLTFAGTLTLSNEGECKLRVASGEEYSFWQFRKLALEPLFFYGEMGW